MEDASFSCKTREEPVLFPVRAGKSLVCNFREAWEARCGWGEGKERPPQFTPN